MRISSGVRPHAPVASGRPRPAHVQAGRDEQDRGAAHPRARARCGRWRRGRAAARPRYQSALEPLSRGARRPSTAGRAPSCCASGSASCCAPRSVPAARGLEAALSLSYFAELLDAFAQEGEAEDAVYRLAAGRAGRRRGRRRTSRAPVALPGGVAAEAARPLPVRSTAARAAAARCPRARLRYHPPPTASSATPAAPASGPVLARGRARVPARRCSGGRRRRCRPRAADAGRSRPSTAT